jgi:HK97 family phage major capsid protein
VPQDFRDELLMLARPQPTAFNLVTVVQAPHGSVTYPALVQTDANNDFGGMSFTWIGEGAEKPEAEPVFEQREIVTRELAGYTEVSDRLLSRSAINIENLLANLSRDSLLYELDRVILAGAGGAQPVGVINAPIRTVARTTAGTVVWQDLVNLKHLLRPWHRTNARFICEDDVEQAMEGQLDTMGRPLFTASVANGPYDNLIGYPYQVSVALPTVGTQGDIVFGDWAQYYVAMEEEVVIAKSEHYRFRHNLVAFKMYLVAGGRAMHPRAFAMLEGES